MDPIKNKDECRKLHPAADLACGKVKHDDDQHGCYVNEEWLEWTGHQVPADTSGPHCIECGHIRGMHTLARGCQMSGCNCPRIPGTEPAAPVTTGELPKGERNVTGSDPLDEHRDGTVGEVIDGRTSVYGEVVPAFTRQAQAISAVLGHEVQPWEVPLIMIAVKLIRTTEAPDYSDNSDDIEGYLDIFRQLMGDDMIEARSVKEYIAKRMER